MEHLQIEQAIYGSDGAEGYRFLAKSPGFRDDWLAEAQRLCTAFGERPAGVACPACLFVQPFGGKHVAVVQVADHGRDDAGRPGTLRFRLLIVPRSLYAGLEGDPFLIGETLPPQWDAKGALSELTWTTGAPPPRTVEMLQNALNVANSPTLLGAAQALIDGGRVAFARSEPDATILRSLWALLPSSSRCELWPATFVFGNVAAFHAVVAPAALLPTEPFWIHEAHAGDYPEGRYELNLQIAVESGNQRDLDTLLARKTRWRMIQLAALILLAMLAFALVPVAINLFFPGAPAPTTLSDHFAVAPQPAAVLVLPPENECPPLNDEDRRKLAAKLHEFAERRNFKDVPGGDSEKELATTLSTLDDKLGIPESRRDRKPLTSYGSLQRQLRAALDA